MRVARFANNAKATIPTSVARINPIRFMPRLLTSLDRTALERESIQEPQLSRKPSQLVHENQPTDEQKERAAKDLDCMQVPAEALRKGQELADTEGRQQKGDRESRRIGREQEHTTGHGTADGGKSEDGRQDRTDARRPPKGEREAKQETTPNAWLSTLRAEMCVAIQPTRHRGSEKTNNGQ